MDHRCTYAVCLMLKILHSLALEYPGAAQIEHIDEFAQQAFKQSRGHGLDVHWMDFIKFQHENVSGLLQIQIIEV